MTPRIASLALALSLAACGAQTSSGKTGGTATTGECKEVGFGEFPGVKSGDKPPLPKEIEQREVAKGKSKFHVGVQACVAPGGNATSLEVTQSSGVPDLDEHVKKTLEGWTFCSFVPEREESQPRCDTLNFDYEVTPGKPAAPPASMPSNQPTPGP